MRTLQTSSLLFLSILLLSCDSQSGNKEKTIKYNNADYMAVGKVDKHGFADGSTLTFLSAADLDTIVSGIHHIENGISYIDGIHKIVGNGRFVKEYGTFKASNCGETSALTSDRKKAAELLITPSDIRNYEAIWQNNPAVLEKISTLEYKLTINYSDKESNLSKIEIPVPADMVAKYGYGGFDSFIRLCTQNVRRTYRSGMVFYGNVQNDIADNGTMATSEKEGEITFSKGNISKVSIHKFDETCYLCTIDYLYNKNNYTKEEFYISNKDIEEYGFWNFGYYKPDVRQCFFKNGDIFTGKVKYEIDDSTGEWTVYTLQSGLMYYSSGEIYTGDFDGEWCCGMPMSGTMTFTDGKEANGNWLDKYHLLGNEADEIANIDSPTEKRDYAEKCYYEIKKTSTDNIKNVDHNQVSNDPDFYLDYFDKQFAYYVYNSQDHDLSFLQGEHKYEDFTVYYGWLSDRTIVLDNTFSSYFWWDINTDVSRPLLRTADDLIYGKLQQEPEKMFEKQDYYDDYLTFLRHCENFIRQDMEDHRGKFEESLCADMWKRRLSTMISIDEYESNYNIGLSYNMFLNYASVAMINDILVKISRERDYLRDSDYVYKRK